MDINQENINLHLKELRECIDKLKPISDVGKEKFINDPILPDVANRNLQLAIQNCLDIGNHIIAACGLELPQNYGEIFEILGKEGVIPAGFSQKIAPMANLRNILIYENLKVDLEKIYEFLQQLEDFTQFAQHILKFIEKNK